MTEGMIPNPDLDPMAAAESTHGAMGRRVFTPAAIGVAENQKEPVTKISFAAARALSDPRSAEIG